MNTIVASAIQIKDKPDHRVRIADLHPNDSTKPITKLYFKSALYVLDLGSKAQRKKHSVGRKQQRIVIVDILFDCVLWGFENKSGCEVSKVRFAKLVTKKGKRGFFVRGKFIKIC